MTTYGLIANQPWQFSVNAYGAAGNGVIVQDGAISSSSNPTHLACTTSTPFTSTAVDGGKYILVAGAGSGGAFLAATISSVIDSGHAVLSTGASTTVSGAGVLFGTDDTSAVQSAINAAVTYAQANLSNRVQVLLNEAIYCIAGAPSTGVSGNAQITLPIVTAATGFKVALDLIGATEDSAPGPHWLQTTLSLPGTVLACMRTDGVNGTSGSGHGPTSIIGGPVNGYGGGLGTFSDMQLGMQGITLTAAWPGTYCGVDLYGVGQCDIRSLSFLPLGIIPSSGAWPQLISGNTNQYQFALRYPTVGNNDRTDAGQITAYGCGTGIVPSEHATCDSLRTFNCYFGIRIGYAAGSNAVHGVTIRYWSCEATEVGINFYGYEEQSAAPLAVKVAQVDFEAFADLWTDPDGIGCGEIWFNLLQPMNHYFSSSPGAQATTGCRIFHVNATPGPLASPQAAPASGTAWTNGYYRDAFITLHAAGTVTALNIDSTAQNVPGATTTYGFMVPSGHSYTPTYGGTAVTHTVTLL